MTTNTNPEPTYSAENLRRSDIRGLLEDASEHGDINMLTTCRVALDEQTNEHGEDVSVSPDQMFQARAAVAAALNAALAASGARVKTPAGWEP